MRLARLALPQRSPSPFSVPCTCRAPASTAASVFATALPVSSCAWIPSRSPGTPAATTAAVIAPTSAGSVPPLVSQSTTQRAPASSAGAQAVERIAGVRLPAVEEMLGVEDRLAPEPDDMRHRRRDVREVLLERHPERGPHMELVRLADQADHRRPGVDHAGQHLVVRRRPPAPLGHPERREPRPVQPRRRFEEGAVGRVRPRPAALDIVDPEPVERRGDRRLVLDREVDPLALLPVPERRVVEPQPLALRGLRTPAAPARRRCRPVSCLDPVELGRIELRADFPFAGGASAIHDLDPGRQQPVAKRVGPREVARRPRALARLQDRRDPRPEARARPRAEGAVERLLGWRSTGSRRG